MMVQDNQRIPGAIRGCSPCKDCPERFTACADHCPKDERGDYGHKAWKDEIKRVKKTRKDYFNGLNIRKKNYDGGFYGEE